MLHSKLLLPLLATCLLAACGRTENEPAALPQNAAPAPASSTVDPTDRWTGKWLGPEGTFLEVEGSGGKYRITVRNLDGARTFEGVRRGDGISFERDGVSESIRAGSGAETGMKWLADKKDCLVVKPGDGYCRD